MNGVLVQMSETQKRRIESLPFVRHTEFVAPNAPLSSVASTSAEGPVIDPINNLAFPQNSLLGVPEMHQEGYRGEGCSLGSLTMVFEICPPFLISSMW